MDGMFQLNKRQIQEPPLTSTDHLNRKTSENIYLQLKRRYNQYITRKRIVLKIDLLSSEACVPHGLYIYKQIPHEATATL